MSNLINHGLPESIKAGDIRPLTMVYVRWDDCPQSVYLITETEYEDDETDRGEDDETDSIDPSEEFRLKGIEISTGDMHTFDSTQIVSLVVNSEATQEALIQLHYNSPE